jgi:selenide,water dikinase
MPQGKLAQVLRGVIEQDDERLLVGPKTVDDAGIVLLDDGDTALVQTVDYFPPVVDDPYFYGAIAAANALSDVYAMGGRPHSALNLAGFPEDFSEEWMEAIFRGGFDKLREAGAVLAGGHTVQTEEVTFGYAVTGTIDVRAVAANTGARAGDRLYLTKAIGMGTLTTSAKLGKLSLDGLRPAMEQMATLNGPAADAMTAAGAVACTDITGFGLAGHGTNIATASGVTLRFTAADVPIFPGAFDLAAKDLLSGGARRGRKGLGDRVVWAEGMDETLVNLFFDAETSGGLLIAIHPDRAQALERELRAREVPVHSVGEVRASNGAEGGPAVEFV